MPPYASTYKLTTTQKRPQEADTTSLTLSDHDLHKFDNMTAARKDPYYEISTPPIKRRRECEDNTL